MDRIFRVADGATAAYAIERNQTLYRAQLAGATIFDGYTLGAAVPGGRSSLRLLAPVVPRKMVCVGLNYRDHAAEQKKAVPPAPMLFLKPSTTNLDPGAAIRLPPGVGRVDYEGELAVVIGRRAPRVPRA